MSISKSRGEGSSCDVYESNRKFQKPRKQVSTNRTKTYLMSPPAEMLLRNTLSCRCNITSSIRRN